VVNWTWEKIPEGYLGLHGKAKLWKKGRKWFLTVDGKDHEIKSRRPSFDHAEGLLKTLGKIAREDTTMSTPERVAQRHTATKTAALGSAKGTVPFKVEVTMASDKAMVKNTIALEGGVGVGKGYEKFKAVIQFSDGKIKGVDVKQGSDLVKGVLWTKEVEKYLKDRYG